MKHWEKISKWIETADFGRVFKRLLILSVVLALAGGFLSAVLLQPQIAQAWALEQSVEQQYQQYAQQWDGQNGRQTYGRDWENWDRWDDWGDWEELSGITALSLPVKITLAGVGCVFLLLAMAWWLLMAAWVRQAAGRSRMNTVLWPLLALAFPVGALLVFLVVRSFLRRRCPACGQWQEKLPYCAHCGTAMAGKCPACGASCRTEDKFCSACGAGPGRAGGLRPGRGGGAPCCQLSSPSWTGSRPASAAIYWMP